MGLLSILRDRHKVPSLFTRVGDRTTFELRAVVCTPATDDGGAELQGD